MHSNPGPRHATHDELLIARLFGDDVDERERVQALDQLAACEDCAALFADLGETAAALPALPVPPRPRDFTLTPADASRIAGRRFALLGFARWARPLGTLLSGVGVAALALAIVVGQLPSGGGGSPAQAPNGDHLDNEIAIATSAGSIPAYGPESNPATPVATPHKPDVDVFTPSGIATDGKYAYATPQASGAASAGSAGPNVVSVTTPAPPNGQTGKSGGTAASAAPSQPSVQPVAPSGVSSSGLDGRLILAAAAVLLLALGLGLVVSGTVAARAGRRVS